MKNIWIILLFISLNGYSQSIFSIFFDLSSPEKCWVVFHPFKAKKAYQVSKEVLKITDSIRNQNSIGKDINGGKLDAFKHSFWIAKLSEEIGKKSALSLGEAHEKGNYQTYKKDQKEDGYVPDKISSEMDLYNNNIGAKIAAENNHSIQNDLVKIILDEINLGKMKILKKDTLGNFLTCEGVIIPKDSLKGKWENNKCLIYSY